MALDFPSSPTNGQTFVSGNRTWTYNTTTSSWEASSVATSKTANHVYAAPNGSAGIPDFRALVAADIPTLNQNTTGTAATITGVYSGTITSGQITTGLGFTPYNATNPSGYITGSGSITGSAGSLTGFTNSNSANPISGPDNLTNNGLAYVTGMSLLGQTDGALYTQAYSTNWVHQIYGDYRTGQIALRAKNNGTWQAWRINLDSGNYTSYAMPSGSSATNSVDVRAPIFYDSNNTSFYLDPNGSSLLANLTTTGRQTNAAGVKTYSITTVGQGNSNTTYEIMRISRDSANWSTNIPYEVTVYSAYYSSGGSTRWSITYGYGDTGTISCIDARGSTKHRVYLGTPVVVTGNISYIPVYVDIPNYYGVSIEIKYTTTEVSSFNNASQVMFTGTYAAGTGGLYSGDTHLVPNGGKVGIGTTNPTEELEAFGTDASIIVHNSGQSRGGIAALSGARIALTTTTSGDDLVFGYAGSPITSAGFVPRMTIDNGTGSITGSTDFRAPIFYDSDDTTYYINPANTATSAYFAGNVTLPNTINAGIRNAAADAWLWVDDAYGNFFIKNASGGFYADFTGYNFRSTSSVEWATMGASYFQHNTQLRSPIYYDSNDTTYYIDANSNSILNTSFVNRYFQRSSGVPTNNLGDPTVTEMALFEEQFDNKTAFFPPANVICETSTDGTTWTAFSVSDANKKALVGGTAGSGLAIPYNTAYFRVRFVNDGNYVFLNALYSYWSSNGHQTKVQIYKKDFGSSTWVQHTSSNTLVSSWPGHLYLPFSGIAYHPGTYVDQVAIVFQPTWNASFSSNGISLYKMQIWGGYPASKRSIYSIDSDKNVTFPSDVRATLLYDTNDTTYYVNPNSTSVMNAIQPWGEVGMRRGDSGTLLRSYNTSAGQATQFYVNHNLGEVEIGNARGIVYAGGTYWQVANSARSPIFYDSDNTAFKADLASEAADAVYTNGGYSISSGDGKGFRFWNDDSYKIYMSSTASATWGGRASGETTSDYNMYFRMSGGTNRGFVFRNGTTNVAGIDSTGRIYSGDGRLYLNNSTNNFIIAQGGTSSALYMEARGGGFNVRDAASGSSWFTALNGICTATASSRAPIFYDTDNTGFYIDPNSVSNINDLIIAQNIASPANYYNGLQLEVQATSGTAGIGLHRAGYSHCGIYHDAADTLKFNMNSGTVTLNSGAGTLIGDGNDTSYIRYKGAVTSEDWNTYIDGTEASYRIATNASGSNRPGAYMYGVVLSMASAGQAKLQLYAPHNGTDGNGLWVRTGWDTDYDAWNEIAIQSRSFTNNVDLRAPRFYDSNNTAYYSDPDTTSVMWETKSYYFTNIAAVSDNHNFGLYFGGDRSSAYAIYREPGAWDSPFPDLRIAFHTGIKMGANSGYNGMRFYTDYDMGTQVMSINNGADGLGASHVFVNNALQAAGSLRAPIFYDSNDTSYYTDPNGTSVLYNTQLINLRCKFDRSWENYPGIAVYNTTDQGPQGDFRIHGLGGANGGDFNVRLLVDGTIQSLQDARAPIFYDSDNTGFYINPNGDTNLNRTFSYLGGKDTNANWNTGFQNTPAASYNYHGDLNGGTNAPAAGWWIYESMRHSNASNYWGTQIAWGWEDNANRLFQRNVANGSFGGWVEYLNTSDRTYSGNLYMTGSIRSTASDMRAPIFYDQDNTGYYVNAAGTSYINALNIGPVANGASYLNINGYNAYGGTGYHGFLTLYNTYSSATNPQQFWRINGAGGWEIVNSPYNAVLFTFTQGGDFTAAGNVTAYSDRKLKDNFESISDPIRKVMKLNGLTFTRIDKEDTTQRYAGLIAQDVEAVLPEAVQINETISYGEVKSVDYNATIALLVEAIKEQQSHITKLEEKLNKLLGE